MLLKQCHHTFITWIAIISGLWDNIAPWLTTRGVAPFNRVWPIHILSWTRPIRSIWFGRSFHGGGQRINLRTPTRVQGDLSGGPLSPLGDTRAPITDAIAVFWLRESHLVLLKSKILNHRGLDMMGPGGHSPTLTLGLVEDVAGTEFEIICTRFKPIINLLRSYLCWGWITADNCVFHDGKHRLPVYLERTSHFFW